MNTDRARTASLRSRHLRLLAKAGIPFPEPGHDCVHPMRALRFDGLQETRTVDGPGVMAWLTCTLSECGRSFLAPVREDVAENAGQDGANVGEASHGGPRGSGSASIVIPDDTSPEPGRSTKQPADV